MYRIEIAAQENGAHRNQEYKGFLLDGEALIREDVKTLENFPFGEITVEEVDGVMVVTKWTALPMPEPEPEPEPTNEPTADELLKILAGVSV